MTWRIENDRELRHLVREVWADREIAERFICEPRDVYERRVIHGLLAIPCREIPWADALRRKADRLERLRHIARERLCPQ